MPPPPGNRRHWREGHRREGEQSKKVPPGWGVSLAQPQSSPKPNFSISHSDWVRMHPHETCQVPTQYRIILIFSQQPKEKSHKRLSVFYSQGCSESLSTSPEPSNYCSSMPSCRADSKISSTDWWEMGPIKSTARIHHTLIHTSLKQREPWLRSHWGWDKYQVLNKEVFSDRGS